MRRCATTYEEIRRFYDRWQHTLGAVLLEGLPPFDATDDHARDSLQTEAKPSKVARRDLRRRMVILSDGSVPISEMDVQGKQIVGNVNDASLAELWLSLTAQRDAMWGQDNQHDVSMETARTFWP